ncbi:MAG: hypothetical protein LRS41_06595 [Caldisphaeraceae archaeon]|nr:hypothetical protein [Caldisphaeraceae archaeon]
MRIMLQAPAWHDLDGSLVPLASTAIHDLITLKRGLWVRWNSLGATINLYKINDHLGEMELARIY